MTDEERNATATRGDIADSEERIMEALRGIETKLLTAFDAYAKTNDKRVLEVEGNEAALRSRMATLETRVLDLEENGNIPPAA